MEAQKISVGSKLFVYLRESWEELKKVAWPSRAETVRQTLIVVVASIITAVFLGLIDYLLQLIISQFVIK